MAVAHEIVGRDEELAQLREVVHGDGPPFAAFLEGDAGVGKTALLEAVVADAGSLVLWTRPTAAEAASSYAALHDLLQPVLDQLEALPAPQRRALSVALLLEDAADPVDQRVVALATRSLLGALDGPVVLAVDDWQWLDAASGVVLSFVLRHLQAGDARLLATVRTGEADEALAALLLRVANGHVRELSLEPLGPASLGRLVHARTGAVLAPPALARLHQASGGNPLVALELARAPDARSATDVRRLMARRVGVLRPEARYALRLAAAMAEPSAERVEQAMEDRARARRGLEEALAAEVLVRDGDRLRFSHPLLAAAAEELTPPGDWAAVHRRLATLATTSEERARHLAAGAGAPAEDVAAVLEAAAQDARARGALGAAGELGERAAELTPAVRVADRARRVLDAADAHTASGDGVRARDMLRALVEEAPAGALRAEALHRLGYLTGDASGPQLVARALAEAGDDDRLLADLHHSMSALVIMQGDVERALRHGEAAVAHAERCGEPLLLAEVLSNLAFARWVGGEGVQRALLLRADRLERGNEDRRRDVTALEVLAMQLRVAGALDAARELLLAELKQAEQRGRTDHETLALRELAELEIRAGRWALAEDYARRTAEACAGFAFWNADAEAHFVTALIDAHRGRVESARREAEAGVADSAAWGDEAWSIRCGALIGFLDLSLGDAGAAARRLRDLHRRERRMGVREPAIACIAPDLVEALVLIGELDDARAVQAELEARARDLGSAWGSATALRCRGLIAAAEGRAEDALSDLAEALERHEDVPQPFDRARTLLALGSVQRRAKQRGEARVSLESALAVFEELGAALWSERARAEIARLGGRRARDRDELTETERRIAELAASGRSNREVAGELFVSERTVEANLTRAYRKLGVRSRTELARRLPAE